MPAALRAEWKGLKEYSLMVKRLPEELQKEAKGILSEGGHVGLQYSSSVVPVKTGRLRGSLRFRQEFGLRTVLSADTPYARFVEFGTRRMRAQPYLRPGLQRAVDYIRENWNKRIALALRQLGWK
jgi:HK97 gp10 family phage protein